MRVLLTGATGFLGSHIAESLLDRGYKLLLSKRDSSDLWRCTSFKEKVSWINNDSVTFEKEVLDFKPEVIINAAWDGVAAANRDIWTVQVENLLQQQRLLDLAAKIGVQKFIGIGSQAEYGKFDGKIDETFPTNPNSAYGAVKLAAYNILRTFCEEHKIVWYWFRLFSCFGEREAENWLIPATIKNMLTKNNMDLTPGEQQYSYLYVKDVANLITCAVDSTAKEGVYHIASDQLRSLKEILLEIKKNLNPDFNLNFGAFPYRENQSMINGSINIKTQGAFGKFETSDFNKKIIQTIDYYKKYFNNER